MPTESLTSPGFRYIKRQSTASLDVV